MKVLLIITICLLVYLVMSFITGLIDAAFDGYVPPDDDNSWSSAGVGLAWPLTLPIMIVILIYTSLDKAIKKLTCNSSEKS